MISLILIEQRVLNSFFASILLYESPSRSSILCLYSGSLRKLRVTSLLLTVFAGGGDRNSILASHPFIRGLLLLSMDRLEM